MVKANSKWSSIQVTKVAREELKSMLLDGETYEQLLSRCGVLKQNGGNHHE